MSTTGSIFYGRLYSFDVLAGFGVDSDGIADFNKQRHSDGGTGFNLGWFGYFTLSGSAFCPFGRTGNFKIHLNRQLNIDWLVIKGYQLNLTAVFKVVDLFSELLGGKADLLKGLVFHKRVLRACAVQKIDFFSADIGGLYSVTRLETVLQNFAGNQMTHFGLHHGFSLLHSDKVGLQNQIRLVVVHDG